MTPDNVNFYVAVQALRSGSKGSGPSKEGDIDPMVFFGSILTIILVGLIAFIVWMELDPPKQTKQNRAAHELRHPTPQKP